MASDQLTTTTSSGQQTITQSPQTAGKPANTGTQSSSVQPGTATALLNSRNGIPLYGTDLPSVSLAATASTTSSSVPSKPVTKHHISVPLLGISVLLCVAAVVLFWATGRSVKSTT